MLLEYLQRYEDYPSGVAIFVFSQNDITSELCQHLVQRLRDWKSLLSKIAVE